MEKTNWVSNFNLVGSAIVGDYTFKINETSKSSNYIYNSLNLKVNCGDDGVVSCNMMDGYSPDYNKIIYVHGKAEDGSDDFQERFEVAWEDRFNESILADVGDMCFITVGLEVAEDDKTFYKKFLAAYDAIAYIKEHLVRDMVLNIKGNLTYTMYNDNTQVNKNVTSIVLSKAEESKYRATFNQSVLLNSDSVDFETNFDKEKNILYVDAKVLDYMKEYKGTEIKGQFPYKKMFEYSFPDITNKDQVKGIYEKLFKVKKGVTQINFKGRFVEEGAKETPVYEDLPDNIKALVMAGIYTKEQVLQECAVNGNTIKRMILTQPIIRTDRETKAVTLQKFEERYKEEDLIINLKKDEDEDGFLKVDEAADSELEWLKALE